MEIFKVMVYVFNGFDTPFSKNLNEFFYLSSSVVSSLSFLSHEKYWLLTVDISFLWGNNEPIFWCEHIADGFRDFKT